LDLRGGFDGGQPAGSAGGSSLRLTQFDNAVDEDTPNRGKQIFEKMISGMYLGELCRLAIRKMVEEGDLFKACPSRAQALSEPHSFHSKHASESESGSDADVQEMLKRFGLEGASEEDIADVRRVCKAIARRSARLVACGVVACLESSGRTSPSSICVDGSVYKLSPYFKHNLLSAISELTPVEVSSHQALDGSGLGAALIASLADHSAPSIVTEKVREPVSDVIMEAATDIFIDSVEIIAEAVAATA